MTPKKSFKSRPPPPTWISRALDPPPARISSVPSVGEVWIFSGITQYHMLFCVFLPCPCRAKQRGGKKEANSFLKKTNLISLLTAILWQSTMPLPVTENFLLSCFVIAPWFTSRIRPLRWHCWMQNGVSKSGQTGQR